MGDIFEITTLARHPTTFYRVSSGSINFDLKAHSAALVGLAKEPGNTCQYWVAFVQGGRVWIKGPEGYKATSHGNYSLCLNTFKRFWISWDSGILRVGKEKEVEHMLSYGGNVGKLNYITFTTRDIRHAATWKLELPPTSLTNIMNHVPCKNITEGELEWIECEDQLPDGAVIGGFEGECLYIIRGKHRGSLTPGKFVPSEGEAYISWGGSVNTPSEFEILCGFNFMWVPTKDDNIPVNALVAGHSEINLEKLYIGRVKYMNCLVPGKVQPSHKVCYIPYGEKELSFKEYEILTIPDLNPYAARKYFETNIENSVVQNEPHAFLYQLGPMDEDEEDDEDDIENFHDEIVEQL